MMVSLPLSTCVPSIVIRLALFGLSLLPICSAITSSTDDGVTTEFVHLSIKPDAKHVHFLQVHLEAPGYIDLSGLDFSTVDTGHDPNELVAGVEEFLEDEDDLLLNADDDWVHPEKKTTMLDVAVVYIPDDCSDVKDTASSHCDFTEVGVGRKYSEEYGLLEEPYWCCTEEEVMMDLCDGSVASYGRMMMNLTVFDGAHRSIEVPPYGEVAQNIAYGKIDEVQQSGKYAVILANCYQEAGREVLMRGNLKVKTSGASPTQINTAMKSFAKQAVQISQETQDTNSSSSSGYGLTIAILVFGLAGAAYIARDNVEQITTRIARGYNTLELSGMEGQSSENDYVPLTSEELGLE